MGGYRSLAALRMIQEILNVVNIEAENKISILFTLLGFLISTIVTIGLAIRQNPVLLLRPVH